MLIPLWFEYSRVVKMTKSAWLRESGIGFQGFQHERLYPLPRFFVAILTPAVRVQKLDHLSLVVLPGQPHQAINGSRQFTLWH